MKKHILFLNLLIVFIIILTSGCGEKFSEEEFNRGIKTTAGLSNSIYDVENMIDGINKRYNYNLEKKTLSKSYKLGLYWAGWNSIDRNMNIMLKSLAIATKMQGGMKEYYSELLKKEGITGLPKALQDDAAMLSIAKDIKKEDAENVIIFHEYYYKEIRKLMKYFNMSDKQFADFIGTNYDKFGPVLDSWDKYYKL